QGVVGARQAQAEQQVLDLDRCEEPVHVERRARAHVQPIGKVEVGAPEVGQQHAAGFEQTNGMVERRRDVVDDVGGELHQEAVVLLPRYGGGAGQVGDDSHVWAVGRKIQSIGLRESVAAVVADGGCL